MFSSNASEVSGDEHHVLVELDDAPIAELTPRNKIESTPMAKEHVPLPEPKMAYELHFDEQERVNFRFISAVKKEHKEKVDSNKQDNNGIFGLMRQAQDNIDQALGLDGDDLKLKSLDALSINSDSTIHRVHVTDMESNKLVEKLEKEKSKRKFCEQKIIDLQKQLIQLEEKNHALKDNCARKNFALRQVDQLLTTNKNELDKYRAAKIAKINQLQGQLDETMSTLTNTQTELETGHLACSQLTEQNDKLNQHVAELERRVLFQSDETETIQTQLDDVSFEKQKVEQNLATMEKELNEKINTLQKTLENERGKVAKYEQEESAEKTRADKLQQNGEMMRVQLEQARVMRENSQKQLQQDRSQWQKKLSELGDQLKQAHDQVKLKNDEVERVKSEKNIATTTIETLEREVNTSKSEMDLLKTRFTNEKDKLEVYFRSVQKSQKIEWEKAAESRLSEAKRTLEYRNNELEMELSQVQQKAAHDLAQLDRRLKEDYQAKIKSFLQQHFNQGLDALGISAPSRRSSSPNISPINSARNMEPRPPLEPRPTAPPPTQATVEPPTRREQELRKMIRNLLSQAPQAPPVPAQLQQNYLSSRLTELSKDNTLTDQDKKSLQRLRQLMTDNL